jgi:hypothetical protein
MRVESGATSLVESPSHGADGVDDNFVATSWTVYTALLAAFAEPEVTAHCREVKQFADIPTP